MVQEDGDVVFVDAVELFAARGGGPAHQAIGSDDGIRAVACGFVEHQQVVAEFVAGIELAAHHRHLVARLGVHLLAKHPEPQFLGRRDLGRRFGQADQ